MEIRVSAGTRSVRLCNPNLVGANSILLMDCHFSVVKLQFFRKSKV